MINKNVCFFAHAQYVYENLHGALQWKVFSQIKCYLCDKICILCEKIDYIYILQEYSLGLHFFYENYIYKSCCCNQII